MKKAILFIFIITIFISFDVKAGAFDPSNYALSAQEYANDVDALKDAQNEFMATKEKLEKNMSGGQFSPNLKGMNSDLFTKKENTPVLPKGEADIADDKDAVSEQVKESAILSMDPEEGGYTEKSKKFNKEQRDLIKLEILNAYSSAVSNRALISEVREKVNDMQDELYSAEDNMNSYKVVPQLSSLISQELQKIIYLEATKSRVFARDDLNSLPPGFKDYEVIEDKNKGDE